jgi:hypothetical protein
VVLGKKESKSPVENEIGRVEEMEMEMK